MLIELDKGRWVDPRRVIGIDSYVSSLGDDDKPSHWTVQMAFGGAEFALQIVVRSETEAVETVARWAEAINASLSVPGRL